jgi:hypothetical protein
VPQGGTYARDSVSVDEDRLDLMVGGEERFAGPDNGIIHKFGFAPLGGMPADQLKDSEHHAFSEHTGPFPASPCLVKPRSGILHGNVQISYED